MNKVDKAKKLALPIAQIKLGMDVPVYQMNGEEFSKVPNQYLKRNSNLSAIRVMDDFIELTDGRYIQKIQRNFESISYGKLVIVGENVNVCSPNGLILRKVTKGQSFKVLDILTLSNMGNKLFKINDKEVINSIEKVMFVSGYFQPSNTITLAIEGKPLQLVADQSYPYGEVNESYIKLNMDTDIWIDISLYEGKIINL